MIRGWWWELNRLQRIIAALWVQYCGSDTRAPSLLPKNCNWITGYMFHSLILSSVYTECLSSSNQKINVNTGSHGRHMNEPYTNEFTFTRFDVHHLYSVGKTAPLPYCIIATWKMWAINRDVAVFEQKSTPNHKTKKLCLCVCKVITVQSMYLGLLHYTNSAYIIKLQVTEKCNASIQRFWSDKIRIHFKINKK